MIVVEIAEKYLNSVEFAKASGYSVSIISVTYM